MSGSSERRDAEVSRMQTEIDMLRADLKETNQIVKSLLGIVADTQQVCADFMDKPSGMVFEIIDVRKLETKMKGKLE